jgi:hypothetical protein
MRSMHRLAGRIRRAGAGRKRLVSRECARDRSPLQLRARCPGVRFPSSRAGIDQRLRTHMSESALPSSGGSESPGWRGLDSRRVASNGRGRPGNADAGHSAAPEIERSRRHLVRARSFDLAAGVAGAATTTRDRRVARGRDAEGAISPIENSPAPARTIVFGWPVEAKRTPQ